MKCREVSHTAFKTATIKQLSDTEGCFPLFPTFLHLLFSCHATLLIVTISPSPGLFVSPSSQPISVLRFLPFLFRLLPVFPSLPSEHLFVCISNILNERVLFCSTGRDCLEACCVRKIVSVCVCVCACDTAVHGKEVMNSSVKQRTQQLADQFLIRTLQFTSSAKNCVCACVCV